MGKYDLLFSWNMAVQHFGGRLISITRIPYVFKEKASLKKNQELFQHKNSDTCYVIGLGPSLKQIDLSKLNGDIIVTNRFYKVDNRNINPTYYIMMDNDFFLEKESKCLVEAKRTFPSTTFILNGKYHAESTKLAGQKNNYYFYSWDGMFNGNEIHIDKVCPAFGNIVCCAIGFALGLGYKRIILLGCDFNSFATQKVEHCYSESKDKPKLRPLSMELFCYSFEAEMHNRLSVYADNHKIEILNGTPNSLIDSYPFLSHDEQKRISK